MRRRDAKPAPGPLPDELIEDLVDAGSREHYVDAPLYDYEYRRRRADVTFYRELARKRGGPILELGAGSGRVTIPLARDGHRVVAVDRAPDMLARLRERVAALPAAARERVDVRAGDLCTFDVRDAAGPSRGTSTTRDTASPRTASRTGSRRGASADSRAASRAVDSRGASPAVGSRDATRAADSRGASRAVGSRGASPAAGSRGAASSSAGAGAARGATRGFALVIAAFNVLEHLYTRGEVAACLARVAAHLAPGGAFAFDVQMPDLDWLARDPHKRWAKTRFTHPTTKRAWFYSTNHDYDPVGQIANIRLHYDPVDGAGPAHIVKLSQRKFFPAELEALLAHSGFQVVERYGDFAWRPLHANAESQVLIAIPRRR